MEHIRLRTFNTRDTYPEQNLDNDLSQGVVAKGATVFLRGPVSYTHLTLPTILRV